MCKTKKAIDESQGGLRRKLWPEISQLTRRSMTSWERCLMRKTLRKLVRSFLKFLGQLLERIIIGIIVGITASYVLSVVNAR